MRPLRILIAATLVVFMGCAPDAVDRDPQVQPPEGVLDRAEFVRVLTEIQMVEAVSNLRTYRNDNEKQRLAEAYNDVWERTGVSAEAFEASYEWWWAQPAAMKEVLREVVDTLKEMESDAKRAVEADSLTPGNLKHRVPVGTPELSTQ
jgi:hypothetical protein